MLMSDRLIARVEKAAEETRDRIIELHAARYQRRYLSTLDVVVSLLAEEDFSALGTITVIRAIQRRIDAMQRFYLHPSVTGINEFYALAPLYGALRAEKRRLQAIREENGNEAH